MASRLFHNNNPTSLTEKGKKRNLIIKEYAGKEVLDTQRILPDNSQSESVHIVVFFLQQRNNFAIRAGA